MVIRENSIFNKETQDSDILFEDTTVQSNGTYSIPASVAAKMRTSGNAKILISVSSIGYIEVENNTESITTTLRVYDSTETVDIIPQNNLVDISETSNSSSDNNATKGYYSNKQVSSVYIPTESEAINGFDIQVDTTGATDSSTSGVELFAENTILNFQIRTDL